MDVEEWLQQMLQGGPVEVGEIRARGKKLGYHKSELRDAKFAIGAKTKGVSRSKGARPSEWYWYLPGYEE